jgi:F0F1-type ATP synthase membrane subunit b/b'
LFRLPREQIRVTDPDELKFEPISLTNYERETLQTISDPDSEALPINLSDDAEQPPQIAASSLEEQSAEQAVAELSAQLADLNAQITANRAELDGISEALTEETERILNNAQAEAEAFKEQIFADAKTAAEEELADAKQELANERERSMQLVENALSDLASTKPLLLAAAEDEIVDFCFEVITQIFGADLVASLSSPVTPPNEELAGQTPSPHEALLRTALRKLGADETAALPESDIFEWNGLTIDASLQTQLRKLKDAFA